MRFQRVSRFARHVVAVPVLAAAGLLVSASANAASVIDIASDGANSTEGVGAFTGQISYEATGLSTGQLIISLTNTSTFGNGGFITGLLFNIASSDANASATLASGTNGFANCTGNGLSGEPFGNPFDAGAALGGEFLGGGNPNGGVAAGESGSWTFNVSASDAQTLTAWSFLTGGPYEFNFLVRFRGFSPDASDKVPATGTVIPLPAPVAMGLLGLVGVVIGTRKMRRNAQPA